METTIDSAGRLVVPEVLWDRLGLVAGSTVEISHYGAGLLLLPVGRTAGLRRSGGNVVAESNTTITDAEVFALMDTSRR